MLVRKRLSFKAMTRRQKGKSFPLSVLSLYDPLCMYVNALSFELEAAIGAFRAPVESVRVLCHVWNTGSKGHGII